MTKGPECDGGVAKIGLVGEHHLQDANISNDGRGDGGDEEEYGSYEQQEGAQMMKDSSFLHFGCLLNRFRSAFR